MFPFNTTALKTDQNLLPRANYKVPKTTEKFQKLLNYHIRES